MAGVKHDSDKVRTDLLPADALWAMAEVLKHGVTKYAERNWEEGMLNSRLRGAGMRHDLAHQLGQENDEESGLPHLAHKATCAMMELALYLRDVEGVWDDRPSMALDAQPAGPRESL